MRKTLLLSALLVASNAWAIDPRIGCYRTDIDPDVCYEEPLLCDSLNSVNYYAWGYVVGYVCERYNEKRKDIIGLLRDIEILQIEIEDLNGLLDGCYGEPSPSPTPRMPDDDSADDDSDDKDSMVQRYRRLRRRLRRIKRRLSRS